MPTAVYLLSLLLTLTSAAQRCYDVVAVTGFVTCNGAPISAQVQLWEEDAVTQNDLMEEVSTVNGFYAVLGHQSEADGIEPFLRVKPSCGVSDAGCIEKNLRYDVPSVGSLLSFDVKKFTIDIDVCRQPGKE